MNWATNITGVPQGSFRSLAGYATEQGFIARAMKAGFSLFFKAWRDEAYDAVLDSDGVLFRVEVKGSSGTRFDLTRGGRSGRQINRNAPNRTRAINRGDCEFVVCVLNNSFDCFVLPVEVIEIMGRQSLGIRFLSQFRESWHLFSGGNGGHLSPEQIRKGFTGLTQNQRTRIIRRVGLAGPIPQNYQPVGTRNLTLNNQQNIEALLIWQHIARH